MALIRHYQPSTRLDHYELDGLMKRFDTEIATLVENGESKALCYIGAFVAFDIIRHHEFVEHQDDFMRLFERMIDDLEGVE